MVGKYRQRQIHGRKDTKEFQQKEVGRTEEMNKGNLSRCV